MKTSAILFVVAPLFVSFISFGQKNNTLDSLLTAYQTQPNDTNKVNTLQKLFNSYIDLDWDIAMKYNTEQLKLASKLDFKKGLGLAYMNAGVLANYSSKIDSGIIHYHKAKNIFNQIKNYRLEAWAIKNMATSEYEKGNYNKALKILDQAFETYNKSDSNQDGLVSFYGLKGLIHYFKGNYKIATIAAMKQLKIVGKNDKSDKASALYLLASIAYSQSEYKKAIQYNLEAAEIYKKLDDKAFELQSLSDIGLNYNALENYPKAIEYLEKSLPIAEELKDLWFKQGILSSLGVAYVEQDKIDEGIKLIEESLAIAKTLGTEDKIMTGYNLLGYSYNKRKNYKRAISYLDKVITEIDTSNNKFTLGNAYFYRSEAYEGIKNYKFALQDFKKFKTLKDTVYNANKSQQIEELNTIYETEKKEQQIALKEKEIVVLEQEAKISNQQKLLLGGGLGLSLIALGFGFYGFRQKIKRNRLEKEKVDTELAFKKKELTTHALHLAKKNEVLESVKLKAKALKEKEGTTGYQELIKTINFDQQDDKNWESFTQYFEQVHKDFAKNVKNRYPEVTKNELRFMALLKMNMSSKEIATILNISPDGIKKARQRLRKKMGLTPDDSLENTVLAI